jgi:hypothetical protein
MNGKRVIRLVKRDDLEATLSVINETNRVSYKAIIPPERFKDPFMSLDELAGEVERMDFFLCEELTLYSGCTCCLRFREVGWDQPFFPTSKGTRGD